MTSLNAENDTKQATQVAEQLETPLKPQNEELKAETENSELDTSGRPLSPNSAEGKPEVKKSKKGKKKVRVLDPEELFWLDLESLNPEVFTPEMNREEYMNLTPPFELFSIIECEIVKMSSHGEGIGISEQYPGWYFYIPFCYPGEKVKCKVFASHRGYSKADLVEVLVHSEDKITPRCQYFGKCSGCQWQDISYDKQLELKDEMLKRAFYYGSRDIYDTLPFFPPVSSPLQYEYRSKITPHFNKPRPDDEVSVGFMQKGRRNVMDIEECILGTPAVNEGYKNLRVKVKENISSYKKGASLIIRESLEPSKEDPSQEVWGTVTDHKGLITTKVGEYRFTFPAGSFFQINTSILPSLIDYVSTQLAKIQPKPKYLLDAYCGSGFFAVGCSSGFEKVVGVDVNQQSIDYATGNAEMNSLKNCSFQVGQAEIIFDGLSFTGKDAAVIIDPPRKGCSTDFLEQLVKFSPEGIVYISCNPFSQAKDLTELLKLCKGTGFTYKVDQVRVFDLFPMTMHGEGLLTLIKVKEE